MDEIVVTATTYEAASRPSQSESSMMRSMTTTTNADGVRQGELATTGVRPFRSRKQRPCDSCRRKRSRCAILEQGNPCVECRQTGKACTFLDKPLDRKALLQQGKQSQQDPLPQLSTVTDELTAAARSPDQAMESFAAGGAALHTHGPSTVTPIVSPQATSTSILPSIPMLHSGRSPTTAFHGQTLDNLAEAALRRPSKKKRRIDLQVDDATSEVSLEALALRGVQATAITSLLTDDLLPMRNGNHTQEPGQVQMSMDRSRPNFFILNEMPQRE